MKDKSDTLNYKVKILNIALFVPVAQLSANVFNEISTILSRKNEPKAISIHYRRIEIRPISLPKNKEEYYSESLFQDADLPCRIVVCFVETAHKNGTPTSNPFAFQRSWTIPKSEKDSKNYYEERSTSNLERLVDDRFCRLEKQFTSLIASFSQAQPQPIKRKTRGKKTDSLPQSDCSDPCTSQEANDRLRQFIEESENQKKCLLDDSQSDLISDDLSVVGETKQIYIKKIELIVMVISLAAFLYFSISSLLTDGTGTSGTSFISSGFASRSFASLSNSNQSSSCFCISATFSSCSLILALTASICCLRSSYCRMLDQNSPPGFLRGRKSGSPVNPGWLGLIWSIRFRISSSSRYCLSKSSEYSSIG